MPKSRLPSPNSATCGFCGVEFLLSRWQRCDYRTKNKRIFYCCQSHWLKVKLNPTDNAKFAKQGAEKMSIRRRAEGNPKPSTYKKLHSRHEHRVVAEQILGRKLNPGILGEVVHHIDGNRHNNAPENLQVMTQSEHALLHIKMKIGAK